MFSVLSLKYFIGRAIRHKDDYATMILIDERFRRDSIISKLPEWLSSSLRPATDTFSTSFQAISAVNLCFFQERLANTLQFFKAKRQITPAPTTNAPTTQSHRP